MVEAIYASSTIFIAAGTHRLLTSSMSSLCQNITQSFRHFMLTDTNLIHEGHWIHSCLSKIVYITVQHGFQEEHRWISHSRHVLRHRQGRHSTEASTLLEGA